MDSNNLELKTISNLVTKSGIVYKIAYDVNKKVEGEAVQPVVLRRDADDQPFKLVLNRDEYNAVITNFKQSHEKRKLDLTIGASLQTATGQIYKLAYETHAVKNDSSRNNQPIILFQENENEKPQIVGDQKEYETVLKLFKDAHEKQEKEKAEKEKAE